MPTFYSQLDSRYARQLLGFNADPRFNLGNFGCLITAWGNMLIAITNNEDYSPPFMNSWLKANEGYSPVKQPDGSYALKGSGVMIWGAPLKLGFVNARGEQANKAAINTWLSEGPNYAIIEVRAGSSQHFVLGLSQGVIVDSLDGKRKSIGTYPIVNAHLYRASGGMGSVTVPDEQTVNVEDVPMTGPDELKAYRVVLGRDPEHAVPDGRTALQFINDAEAEANQQRAKAGERIALLSQSQLDLQNALDKANTDKADLQRRLDGITAAVTVPPPLTPPPTPDFTPQMDSITKVSQVHATAAQGYGLTLRFTNFLRKSLNNMVFKSKL